MPYDTDVKTHQFADSSRNCPLEGMSYHTHPTVPNDSSSYIYRGACQATVYGVAKSWT